MSFKILAISPKEHEWIVADNISAIGGSKSSGISLKSLKGKDDYVIVTPQSKSLKLHLLSGIFSQKTKEIKDTEVIHVGDLCLVFLKQELGETTQSAFESAHKIEKILLEIDHSKNPKRALEIVLVEFINSFMFEKGVVVTKNADQKYEICANVGLNNDDSWLSEGLIQKTIESKRCIELKNVVGSEFEKSLSIQASQFLSIFTWPLHFQGESLGVIMVGTSKPHSGLDDAQKKIAGILTKVASLSLYFYLRNQIQQSVIDKLRIKDSSCPIITASKALQEVCQLSDQVATSGMSVLIQGETGVGKELLAQWIHQQSGRKQDRFIAVNCGAIPGELLESILFGHLKGSFTGAHKDQIGKFELANGGTIFLDEVADLPESMQVKLLRVLQEEVIEPLGSLQPKPIDLRVVAATHKDLPELVREGKFREDLYYRLAEMTFLIPPLRERVSDVVVLSEFFLKNENRDQTFSPGAWTWLKTQPWHGNVRELKSAIKRASILAQSKEIKAEDFSKGVILKKTTTAVEDEWLEGGSLDRARQRFTFKKVKKALELSDGKRKEAAQILGVTSRTLFRYLDEMNKESEQNAN